MKVNTARKPKFNPKLLVGRKAVDRLGLQYETDENGKPKDKKDINFLSSILGQMLQYPSALLASKHRRANKLGNLDRKIDQKQIEVEAAQERPMSLSSNPQYQIRRLKIEENKPCKCCGLPIQKAQLSLWTSHEKVLNLGLSNLLYFAAIKNIMKIIILIYLVLGVFLIVTNVVSSIMYKSTLDGQTPIDEFKTYEGVLAASIGSKQYLRNHFAKITILIQNFLTTLCIIIIMWFGIYQIIVRNKKMENLIDGQTITASDFTLMFSNIPKKWGDLQSFKELEQMLNTYVNQVKRTMGKKQFENIFGAVTPIKIASTTFCINMDLSWTNNVDQDFKDEGLRKVNESLKKIQSQLFDIVKKRQKGTKFEVTYERLEQLQNDLYRLREEKLTSFKQNIENVYNQILEKEDDSQIIMFVSFEKTENKELLQKLYSKRYSLIHKFPCFYKNRTYFQLLNQKEKQQVIHIEPAPEPEDIYWQNFTMSKTLRYFMRFITFAVTLLILYFAFKIIYYLKSVELTIANSNISSSSSFLRPQNLMKIGNSIFLPVLNLIISGNQLSLNLEIIKAITKIEKNISDTHQQTSILFKSICGLVLNSIVIPLVANNLLKDNLYGVGGLADEVFSQAISLAIITPLLKFPINPSYGIYKAKLWWHNRSWKKLQLSQRQLNKYFQELKFEVGSGYVEIMTMYLYCCFYATLQPLIIPIILVGLFLLLIAQRASLYKYSCRPVPGNSQINDVMMHIICAGPLFLALGDFLWTYQFATVSHGFILNLIALILGVIVLLFPFNYFANKSLKKSLKMRPSSYNKDRIFFPSQYQRLNPITSKKGQNSYRAYVRKYLDELVNNKKSSDEIEQIKRRLYKMNMYGSGQQLLFQCQQDIGHQEPYVEVFINGQNLKTIKQQYGTFLKKQKQIIDKYNHLKYQEYKKKHKTSKKIKTQKQFIESENIDNLDFRIFIGDYNNNQITIEEVDFDLIQTIDHNSSDLDQLYKPSDDHSFDQLQVEVQVEDDEDEDEDEGED